MAAIAERARLLGMSPQRYIKHLVEEDLAVSERATTSTFEELLGAGRAEDEAEIDRRVKEAGIRVRNRNALKGNG